MTKALLSAQALRWLLLLSSILLVAGFFIPMLTLTKLLVISHSFSIVTGVWQLLQEGHFFLFVLVSAFSIVLPIMKIVLLFNLLHPGSAAPGRRKKLLHLMHEYGRWAMLDVMVVAVLIVTVKLGALASIEIHPGLYIFGTAVLLIMFATQQVVSLLATENSTTKDGLSH
ncbi:MAG: paraquat-inducible protein A [Piscirickettsiaceae bacterium]|jgi:paraquat-inducible protein A|nr:paraquat-inducible protein A [Piscirickettsiaceae bacterium]